MPNDEGIARIAEAQHGLVTRAQARALGLSPRAIRHQLDRDRWAQVRPGVYLIRGVPRSWPQAVLAVVLAAGEFALASHRTAARLWRLPVAPGDRIEVTTPIERQVRLPGVRGHRSGLFDERDLAVVHHVPVTAPARTLADLSRALTEGELGAALDEGIRRGVLSLSAMHAVAQRFGIAPGRSPKTMLGVLARRIPGYDAGDSELETHVWEVIRNAGLPPPVRRHPIRVNGRRYVIDLAYPDQRVAIEVDGFGVHGTRTAFDHDRARQNALVLDRWQVLRFTSRSTDEQIANEVAHALFGRETTP